MDIALENAMKSQDLINKSLEDRDAPRVQFSKIPVPGITPEMIAERETAHLKAQERADAAANQPAQPAIPHITEAMALAAVQAYGHTVLNKDDQGGAWAAMEAENARLKELNAKLVERVNRAENVTHPPYAPKPAPAASDNPENVIIP
jgi:hypothetical protein